MKAAASKPPPPENVPLAYQVPFPTVASLASTFVKEGTPPHQASHRAICLLKICTEALAPHCAEPSIQEITELAQLAVRELAHVDRTKPGEELVNAVNAALDLWECSIAAMRVGRVLDKADPSEPPIPDPEHWPATLKDFYRLVIGAREEGDCQHRFKRFLESEADDRMEVWRGLGETWPEERIAEKAHAEFMRIQQTGFAQDSWEHHAQCYYEWWKAELSKTRSGVGRKGQKARSKHRRNKPVARQS
jgi:hypothetical protein